MHPWRVARNRQPPTQLSWVSAIVMVEHLHRLLEWSAQLSSLLMGDDQSERWIRNELKRWWCVGLALNTAPRHHWQSGTTAQFHLSSRV